MLMLIFLGPVHADVLKGPYLIYDGVNTGMTLLWQLDSTQSCHIDWGMDTSHSMGIAGTAQMIKTMGLRRNIFNNIS